MPGDPRIQECLEEIMESGRAPEEVCADIPELLGEIRKRLRRVRSVEAQLEDLFPSSSMGGSSPRFHDPGSENPRIPGYEFGALLGRGGMGAVYKARHIKLNRSVAVKLLLSGVYASPIERTRFLREAEVVARLSHCHVVQVHDVGECDGRPYFTMELVEGGTLAQKLDGTPWPAQKAATFVATLAQAVEAAHKIGVIHRDLKPGNILLTPDGTPKISDFGLARRDDDDMTVTLSGTKVGTPCYMSPEQALGQTESIGPATDIYSLGAILYELLTGRPPFRGESTAETERQLILHEPVSPCRLNARVPRDLDTICLKCLRKEPGRRYGSASELARDLGRFLRDEPISARRTGVVERTAKWVHRHPAMSVAAIACFLLSTLMVWQYVWSKLEQGQFTNAMEGDLKVVSMLQQDDRWDEAKEALKRANAIQSGSASRAVRQQCDQAARDLDLAIELDKIRLNRATGGLLAVYRDNANQQYGQAFAVAGLGGIGDAPLTVAMRVDVSALRLKLLAALDDWAFCASDPGERDWILEVARLADPDPLGWKTRILDPNNWNNPKALVALSDSLPLDKLKSDKAALPLLLALGERLTIMGIHSGPYLARVQQQYPDDFWTNLVLGNALLVPSPGEAREYYRVALSRRPNAPVGYCAVGDTLRLQNGLDEAFVYYRKALQFDSSYARAYCNIGLAYEDEGKFGLAIEYYNKSLALDPQYAWSYFNMGNTFAAEGESDRAMDAYRKAVALEPHNTTLVDAVRSVRMEKEPADHGWPAWHTQIEADPPNFDDWWGYEELTLFLGKVDDYRSARTTLLKQFGDCTDPMITEKIGRACLMLPGTPDETRIAATLIQRAYDARGSVDAWIQPYFIFAEGFSCFRQGRLDEAIAIMQHSNPNGLGPAPQLVLAMALYQKGEHDEALKTLASATASFDWRPTRATERDIWFIHILRRQAEAMILPQASAFLQGKFKPHTNDERLALLGVCEFSSRHATEAQLLTDAFAADPSLESTVQNGLRYRAACAAAMAGAGKGGDARKLSAGARAKWRDQAIDWLQADLTAMNSMLVEQPTTPDAFVETALSKWPGNKDLVSIHDPAAVGRLSPAEQVGCNALWSDVAATLEHARAQGPAAAEEETSE